MEAVCMQVKAACEKLKEETQRLSIAMEGMTES